MIDVIQETLNEFYNDVRDVPTEDFYKVYLKQCEKYDVRPAPKQGVIRKVCAQFNLRSVAETRYVFRVMDE